MRQKDFTSARFGGDATGNVSLPNLTVDFTSLRQFMDGFGANEAFLSAISLSSGQADTFFGTGSGQAGLSLLLIGIEDDGTNMGNWATAAQAVARGVKLIAQPWSAAAAQKDNGSINNGGHLLSSAYGAWSDTMVAFDGLTLSNTGSHLYAYSIQNEPDLASSFASMQYTTAEMVAFVKVLGPKIRSISPGTILIANPATSNWDNSHAYATAILADSTAAQFFDIGCTHQYFGTPSPVSVGTRTWMTEFSTFDAFDSSITNGIARANDIHNALVNGGVSAWLYWWLIGLNADNEGLIGFSGNTTPTKRLWVLGNWARFVRPGMFRVNTVGAVSGVSVTAFKNNSTGAFAIVAINNNTSSTPVNIALTGLSVGSVTPWRTSATEDLVVQTVVSVSGGVFAATLAATSVTTFVGVGS